MEYVITLLLGIILGVLIFFILRPSSFVSSKTMDFAVMEAMFEEFIRELDQKQETFREEIAEVQESIREIQGEIEARFAEALVSPKVVKVHQLADKGCGVEEIARKLSMGKGEVELILNLRKTIST